MDFYEVIDARRSYRNYTSEEIPDEILERLANVVHAAPSASNRQPYKFLAVRDPDLRAEICEVTPQAFLKEAPVIIAALGNSEQAWIRPTDHHSLLDVDIAIAMEHMMLAAAAEGLGTCWVGAIDVKALNEVLGLAAPWNVLALSPLGYPAAPPRDFFRNKSARELFEVVD